LEYFEMKKTLVALAALAVVSAASAQSTVTMYGVVDMGIANLKDSLTAPAALGLAANGDYTKNGVQQGTMSNSRIGFKGTEDLGGGLKADFKLELAVLPDEKAGSLSTRVGTVGLSGNFGAVTIGRQYTPYFDTQNAMDLAGNLNATPGYVVNAHIFDGGRASNSVKYASPTFGGFTALAIVGAGTATSAATGTAAAVGAGAGTETVNSNGNQAEGKMFGLAGIYAAGPLVAGLAYNDITNPSKNATIPLGGIGLITASSASGANTIGFGVGSDEVKTWAAGVSYDFAVVKASVAYSNLTDTLAGRSDLTSKGYNFSIAAPFGATTLVANLGRANVQGGALGLDTTITGFQLMANYALSKRTTAYAVAGRDTTNDSAFGDVLVRTSTAVGVRHTF
jgi:predicted porin